MMLRCSNETLANKFLYQLKLFGVSIATIFNFILVDLTNLKVLIFPQVKHVVLKT